MSLIKILRLLFVLLVISIFFSCSKDTDLLSEYVISNDNESVFERIAINDTYTISPNVSMIMDVLSNDNLESQTNISIIETTQPSNGTITINENNTLTFIPNSTPETVVEETVAEEDSFTYTVDVNTEDGNNIIQTAEVTIKTQNEDLPTIYFSDFCNNCSSNASEAIQSAFNAMNPGDIFEFDTSETDTYEITSQLTIKVPGTYNFNGRMLKRKDYSKSFYGDITCTVSNVTFNNLYWDGNSTNSNDGNLGFGVKATIAFGSVSNITMNNTTIKNTRQMAFAGSTMTNFKAIGGNFENIGEHVYYFANGLAGIENLWQDINVGEYGANPENISRNVEFIKCPSNSTSSSAKRILRNITFNMPNNPGGSVRNIIANTIFDGEIWENINAVNVENFYPLYATDDPSTLTIRNSNFGQNDLFLRVVGQVQSEDNYQNANANTIACSLVVENTTAALGRLTNVLKSWSGGQIYFKNPKEVNLADKRNYETNMSFCNVDMIFETSMSLHEIRGNILFNGVRFTSNNESNILDIGDSTGRSGIIIFKNCTIDVDNSLFLTNSYGGSINAIFENTNTFLSHAGSGTIGLVNGAINIEVDTQSSGGIDCL